VVCSVCWPGNNYYLGLIFRPHLFCLRFREKRWARTSTRIRSDISTNDLPEVILIAVAEKKNLQSELLRMYNRNPSPQNIAPQDRRALQGGLAKGTQYWLVKYRFGRIVGANVFFDNL